MNNLRLVHCLFIRRKNGTTKFTLQKHFLAVETQIEDTGIKETPQKLYNEELDEIQLERKHGVFGDLEKLSSKDKQFMMMMMENGAEFVNGNYQLSLPLRNPALIMPNNRTMVEKTANYLKK